MSQKKRSHSVLCIKNYKIGVGQLLNVPQFVQTFVLAAAQNSDFRTANFILEPRNLRGTARRCIKLR